VVEKQNIITGSDIEPGNIVVGLASSGLHSNGFSLVRKVFGVRELQRMSKELLRPTRIYVKPVVSLLDDKGISKKELSGELPILRVGHFLIRLKGLFRIM
jgi:Phosphoribosylaminoimidazole (AIR) synthetase